MDQTAQQEKSPQPSSSNNNSVVFKTIIFTIIILISGVGVFYLGYQYGLNNTTKTAAEVPYGDEDLGNDQDYKSAMEKDPDTGRFVSYNGYSLVLPSGWRKINNMSTDLSEVFSSLSDTEIESIVSEDPYNPSYYLELDVRDNPDGVTLEEWATNSNYSPQGLGQIVKSVKLGSYDAVKVSGNQGDGFVDYYISQNGKMYNLGYFYNPQDPQWQAPSGLTSDVFENIISSFVIAK